MNKNNYKYWAGFSLLELMVAMMLGLFLIAGVGTVYVSSKQTYATRNQISELDESARVAINALREHIEHAGYPSTTGVPVSNYLLPTAFVPAAAACPRSGNTNIISVNNLYKTKDGTSTGTVGGDSIAVGFLADTQLDVDCTASSWVSRCLPDNVTDVGLASREARMVYNSFSVVSSTRKNSINENIPELSCGGSLNVNTQPWAQGIEQMQIRYGVDVLPNPVPIGQKKMWEVDNYWTATEVSNNNAWDKVALVQVALLVRTVEPVFPNNQQMNYQLFEKLVSTNDRYKRAVYTTTIHLRNIAR